MTKTLTKITNIQQAFTAKGVRIELPENAKVQLKSIAHSPLMQGSKVVGFDFEQPNQGWDNLTINFFESAFKLGFGVFSFD